jgi:IS1 family transposase
MLHVLFAMMMTHLDARSSRNSPPYLTISRCACAGVATGHWRAHVRFGKTMRAYVQTKQTAMIHATLLKCFNAWVRLVRKDRSQVTAAVEVCLEEEMCDCMRVSGSGSRG